MVNALIKMVGYTVRVHSLRGVNRVVLRVGFALGFYVQLKNLGGPKHPFVDLVFKLKIKFTLEVWFSQHRDIFLVWRSPGHGNEKDAKIAPRHYS